MADRRLLGNSRFRQSRVRQGSQEHGPQEANRRRRLHGSLRCFRRIVGHPGGLRRLCRDRLFRYPPRRAKLRSCPRHWQNDCHEVDRTCDRFAQDRCGEAPGRRQTDRGEHSPASAKPHDPHAWTSARGIPRPTTRALMPAELVLDASVSLAWFLKESPERAAYAAAVSARLKACGACRPRKSR